MNNAKLEKQMIEDTPELKEPTTESLAQRKSNVEATLKIPVDGMTKEQFESLFKAEEYLRKAGVSFDTGMGCGNRDWELDWSLKGAYLRLGKMKISKNSHLQRTKRDIAEFMKASKVWGTEGDKELSGRAHQVFAAFVGFISEEEEVKKIMDIEGLTNNDGLRISFDYPIEETIARTQKLKTNDGRDVILCFDKEDKLAFMDISKQMKEATEK